ncbi:MAG: cupredoxin domain-containing protein [Chloroflexota bacterium]
MKVEVYMIRILALAILAPLVLLAACSGDDDNATTTAKPAATTAGAAASGGAAKDLTITAADFSLTPATVTGSVGQVFNLTFKNTGNAEHSFTIGTNTIADADGGATKTATFTLAAGDTEFHCKYHPTTMKGTITIGAASSNGLGTNPAAASATTASGGISGGIGY